MDESNKESLVLKIGKVIWLIFGTFAMILLGIFLYFMVKDMLLS